MSVPTRPVALPLAENPIFLLGAPWACHVQGRHEMK